MKPSTAHLKDDRLFECYLSARTGEPRNPRDAEHLVECGECTVRYTELARFMEGLRQNADAELDALFPPERLQAQQSQILRRLSRFQRAARVISFPVRDVAVAATPKTRVPPRWLAAAAAAGLFIGVAVGGLLGPGTRQPSGQPMQVVASPAAQTPAAPATRAAAAEAHDDDAFLMELELALERPHLRELQPFDALTPHVREIGARVQ